MTVYDLNSDQLNELKVALFYGCPETAYKPIEELKPEYADVWISNDLPDALVYEYFGGILFVEEDFF